MLARLLTPNDYGTVALLSIFIVIANSIVSCGFGNALVQRKNVGDLEFNSVFYTSVFLSLVVYLIMFSLAPAIAKFYNIQELRLIMRVVAIQVVFNAINSVQDAELSRKMLFNYRFRVNCIVCVTSAVVGVTLAFCGFGVWTLVWATISSGAVGVLARWFIISWRPKLMFSIRSLKGLFSYGWKLTITGLIGNTYEQLYGFLVGKVYSPVDLAFVEKGNATPLLVTNTVNETLLSVTFPALSKLQGDTVRFRNAMRRMIQSSSYLMIPMMMLMAVCARPIVKILFGSQWLPAVLYVQIACFSRALSPFTQINVVALWAQGRSDILLKLEILKKSLGLILMLCSIKYGVLIFMATLAFVNVPFAAFVNMVPNGRLLGYTAKMQLVDVLPIVGIGMASSGVAILVSIIAKPIIELLPGSVMASLIELLLMGGVGCIVYFILSVIFKVRPLGEFINILETALKGRAPQFVIRLKEAIK
jgi:O-antigen/teichoic acid export membrane protein